MKKVTYKAKSYYCHSRIVFNKVDDQEELKLCKVRVKHVQISFDIYGLFDSLVLFWHCSDTGFKYPVDWF